MKVLTGISRVFYILLTCALVLGVGEGVVLILNHRAASASYTCAPGPDEQCPSDTMVKDWTEYKAIQDRYKMSREDELKANGLIVEMQKEAAKYPGTNWDDKKLRFVKVKVASQPAPPAPATPEKK